ncbi:hypothetical protein pdul_cds_662 [Pandoravirus dulcis]|uniref:Uncharacterized protein n=1 Tax=Pandoravirus dulcis TaxID=1349409 RepID=S4VY36_9VIRU|nr:hypothetical protein pdul_cds_662 [Pandoravirus dulcis]AGO82809.1 hypothetical protein pdul_cds_662 [Pandoravirus dulcis]
MNDTDLPVSTTPRYPGTAPAADRPRCRCARCTSHASASPVVDWHCLWRCACAATATTATGIAHCIGGVAAAAPPVAAFYATATAVHAVAASVSGNGALLGLLRLEPVPDGRVCSLVVLYAAAYGIDSVSRNRTGRGLSAALLDASSRALRMAAVIATASCAIGSMAVHSSHFLSTVRWVGRYREAYKEGLLDGVALGATVAIVAATGVILFQAPCAVMTRLRHVLARAIDADMGSIESVEASHAPDRTLAIDPDNMSLPSCAGDADETQPA